MSDTSTIPRNYQNANPLLYTLRDYNTGIQPYWVIISQFFVFEFSLRTWNRVVYGTWLLPIELITISNRDENQDNPRRGIIVRQIDEPHRSRNPYVFTVSTILILRDCNKWGIKIRQKKKRPKFDLSDIFFTNLPLLAHVIWYCYIQSSCMSAESATVWNCYNLFGYRLYNYIFSDYVEFLSNFIPKLIFTFGDKEQGIRKDETKRSWLNKLSLIIHYIGLFLSFVTYFFVGALLIPYFYTNLLPMIGVYIFILIVYIYILTVIKLIMFYVAKISEFVLMQIPESRLTFKLYRILCDEYKVVMKIGLRLLPYMMSIFFNYSQYFYYGEDYIQTMTNEYNSRDIPSYFDRVRYTPEQIGHTILTFI